MKNLNYFKGGFGALALMLLTSSFFFGCEKAPVIETEKIALEKLSNTIPIEIEDTIPVFPPGEPPITTEPTIDQLKQHFADLINAPVEEIGYNYSNEQFVFRNVNQLSKYDLLQSYEIHVLSNQ